MKHISKYLSSILTRTCAALLSTLGFSSCTQNEYMYGTPIGDFEIKGEVTTEEGTAVDNAEIRVTYPNSPSGIISIVKGHTEKDGKFDVKERWSPIKNLKVVCVPDSPELEADSVNVEMDYSGKDGWYEGHAEKTVNFRLKKKE